MSKINVDAKQDQWKDSAVRVQQGDQIEIVATGLVRVQGKQSRQFGPAGYNGGLPPDENFACSTVSVHTLLVMISATKPRFKAKADTKQGPLVVGNNINFVAQADGTLYFILNDNKTCFHDNSGSFDVEINVIPYAKITVYKHVNYNQEDTTAPSKELTAAASTLGDLDNQISSCKVEAGEWELFEETNFKTLALTLKRGDYNDIRTLPGGQHDHISSLRPKKPSA